MPGPGERIATGRSFYLSTAASEDRLKRVRALGGPGGTDVTLCVTAVRLCMRALRYSPTLPLFLGTPSLLK